MDLKIERNKDQDMTQSLDTKNTQVTKENTQKQFVGFKHVSTQGDSYAQKISPKLAEKIEKTGLTTEIFDKKSIDFLSGDFKSKDFKKNLEKVTESVVEAGGTKENAKDLVKASFALDSLNKRAEDIIDRYRKDK